MLLSAPGKLFLLGEYAVVRGAPAVVLAVNRRARTAVAEPLNAVGALVEQAWKRTFMALGHPIPDGIHPPRVDSSAFYESQTKLGLGSSAAVCLLACAAAWRHAGREFAADTDKQALWRTAKTIHDDFQQAVGSGADLAASLWGGVLRFQANEQNRPVAQTLNVPEDIRLRFIWTKQASGTGDLLRMVNTFAEKDPQGHSELFQNMERTTAELLHGAKDAANWVCTMRAYGQLMQTLGERSRAAIVTPEMDDVRTLAERCGGTAKPSGAGGGDFVVAVFMDSGQVENFDRLATASGHRLVNFQPDKQGLREESNEEPR